MSELEAAFQEVDGVGEVKSQELAEIARAHGESDTTENVQEAIEYLEAGHEGYALKFLRRVVD